MNQKQVIEKRDFDNWMKDPVTIDIMKSLESRRNILCEQILFNRPYTLELQGKHFVYRGMIDVYNELLGISYNDFQKIQGESKDA